MGGAKNQRYRWTSLWYIRFTSLPIRFKQHRVCRHVSACQGGSCGELLLLQYHHASPRLPWSFPASASVSWQAGGGEGSNTEKAGREDFLQ